MKKKSIVVGIALVLALAMVLCTCKEEEVECGWLTIKNLPPVPSQNYFGDQVYWLGGVYYDNDVTSYSQLIRYATDWDQLVASFENPGGSTHTGTSPFPLMEDYQKGFLRNGIFLVYIQPADVMNYNRYEAYMPVTFTNGRATIDFNEMLLTSDIP